MDEKTVIVKEFGDYSGEGCVLDVALWEKLKAHYEALVEATQEHKGSTTVSFTTKEERYPDWNNRVTRIRKNAFYLDTVGKNQLLTIAYGQNVKIGRTDHYFRYDGELYYHQDSQYAWGQWSPEAFIRINGEPKWLIYDMQRDLKLCDKIKASDKSLKILAAYLGKEDAFDFLTA